jgi:gentisate 1,2-dioxygenase
MTEEQVLVIQGRGYDVHDGSRWDWETGDLVSIPAMAEHQHFNVDVDHPALLLSSMPSVGVGLGLGGIEQLEDAPEYPDSKNVERDVKNG